MSSPAAKTPVSACSTCLGDSHFPDTRHPDERPPVTYYEIGRRVSTLVPHFNQTHSQPVLCFL